MKLHPILSKEYYLWWAIMALCSIIIYSLFGLPQMQGYDQYGIIFWTFATLFTSLIYGSIIYLIYRLFSRKWNNKAFMIIISIMHVSTLFISLII